MNESNELKDLIKQCSSALVNYSRKKLLESDFYKDLMEVQK